MTDGFGPDSFKQVTDQLSSVDELAQKSRAFGTSVVENDAAREEALKAELRGVQQLNTIVSGVTSSLEKANENMGAVSSTVETANTLLNLWIRILSQAEHNQRLLQSTHWEGITNEQAAVEAEALARQQAAQRRAEEARERAAAREREAAAAEARRLAAEKKPTGRGTRGRRGVPSTRGTVGAAGRGGVSNGSSSSSTRGLPPSRLTRGSGIGRGVPGSSRGARRRGTGS